MLARLVALLIVIPLAIAIFNVVRESLNNALKDGRTAWKAGGTESDEQSPVLADPNTTPGSKD